MELVLLDVERVKGIHDQVINPGELEGLAGSKSLEGALSRIDFRITYGLIKDEFDLAATYAIVIAQGHVFNDANKRTAYACMELSLKLNMVEINFDMLEIGDTIIKAAQGHMDERELADWLRRMRIKELERRQ